MRHLTVAVVGAGTAGAAAGTLLARAGHDVTVFERRGARADRLGPLRRRMTRTMIGVDRGIVRRPMPLDGLPRLPWPALAEAA